MTRAGARGAGAWAASAVLLAPLAYLVLGAFHAPGPRGATLTDALPVPPSLDGFALAADVVPLGRQLLNSLTVVAVAVPVAVLVASWAGFGLTQLDDRRRRRAVAVVLVLLVVPASAVWVPRFVILSEIGLVDSLVPLMLPALAGVSPFAVLLFYWAFRRLPAELTEAARLEGLGPLATWRLLSPLVRPTTIAVGAVVFALTWGNFADALLYLYRPEVATVPLGASQLRFLASPDMPGILAGALIITAPPVMAFALVQRRFLRAARGVPWLAR